MSINGKVSGAGNISKKLEDIFKNARNQSQKDLISATLMVHGSAIKLVRETSSGKTEIRYSPKRTVTVSKPGDAPNTDRGTLLKNIGYDINLTEMTSAVGTNYLPGKHLELGTTKMEARPWLLPAFRMNVNKIIDLFAKGYSMTLKLGAK